MWLQVRMAQQHQQQPLRPAQLQMLWSRQQRLLQKVSLLMPVCTEIAVSFMSDALCCAKTLILLPLWE